MTNNPSSEAKRMRSAIESFLNACISNQIAFEPQAAYTTQAEADGAGRELWERYCELHRSIGRPIPEAMNVPGGRA